ncbi:Fe-S cluster assembly protein SufD [soil metagenome]
MSVAPLNLPWATAERAQATSRVLGEPEWLLTERMDAFERLGRLPTEPNQLFTPYLDLRSVSFGAVTPIEPFASAEAGGEAGPEALPEGAAALISVGPDGRVHVSLGDTARAIGLVAWTFGDILATRPELVRPIIEAGRTVPEDDAFGQAARALASVGIFIHVPAGAALADPIVLRWTAGKAGKALLSRTVLSLGEAAQALVFEEQVGSDGSVGTGDAGSEAEAATAQWWGTTEIDLAAGAVLEFTGEQDFGPDTAAFASRRARLARDASVAWAIASVGGRLHRSRVDNELDGRGATVRQVEIGFGDGRQLFDLTSYTRHIGQDTTSDLLSKGVFTGRSRGYIKGMIEIARSAKGTDTFLGEFSMLLERTARSVTIPSLEIDQPDVRRAMHSSSVGPIDETQVFYLMSRGLSRDAARRAIVLGFLEPVVARIPLPAAQDRLRALLERKWPSGSRGQESGSPGGSRAA